MQGNEHSHDNLTPHGTTISWTVEKTQELETAYQAALAAEEDSFIFDGNTYVTRYAMYLLQYLGGEFRRRGLWPVTGA